MEKKLKSRKLWVTVATAALIAMADELGIDKASVEEIIKLVVVYLGAQGAHDIVVEHRKGKK